MITLETKTHDQLADKSLQKGPSDCQKSVTLGGFSVTRFDYTGA